MIGTIKRKRLNNFYNGNMFGCVSGLINRAYSQVFSNHNFSGIDQGAEQSSGNPTIGLQYHIPATDGTLPGSVGDIVVADAAFSAITLDANNKIRGISTSDFLSGRLGVAEDENNYIVCANNSGNLSRITDTPSRLHIKHSDVTAGVMLLYKDGLSIGDIYLIQCEVTTGYTITGDGIFVITNGGFTSYETLTSSDTKTFIQAFVPVLVSDSLYVLTGTSGGAGSCDIFIKYLRAYKVN